MTKKIEHVSQTAALVALFRAHESHRKDRLFNDPFAAQLAGQWHEDLHDFFINDDNLDWALAIRTKTLDDLIMQLVAAHEIDTIINLGAGLDARPYRLDLTVDFKWVEVDLPHILSCKQQVLHSEKPACHVVRIACDLSNKQERQLLYEQLKSAGGKKLVLTEGLLVYLSVEQVDLLAQELSTDLASTYWLLDTATQSGVDLGNQLYKDEFAQSNPFSFGIPDDIGVRYFERFGWLVSKELFLSEEAEKYGRLPAQWRNEKGRMYGYSLLMSP